MDEEMKVVGSRVYRNPLDNQYYKAQRLGRFEAQLITPEDISEIESVTVLDEVLGLARPQYNLRDMCRMIRMASLTQRIDVATGLTGQEKVPPLVEAEISAQAYTPVNFDLWKNVVPVALSDESVKKAAHDIMNLHVNGAAKDLARMENKQIKEIAEACTEKVSGTAYSDWSAMTSGVSDTNPLVAILASMNYIRGKGHEPNFMAMHPTLWMKFITNTHIHGMVKSGLMSPALKQLTLPGYPTVKVLIDAALTETPTASLGPLVGSSSAPALVLGEGPTEAAKYRNEPAGYYAHIIRQWLEPKLVLDDAIDKICT